MIETRLLHYFLAVSRAQSITKAAEELHISQPTLSKQLMELERQLGKQLFIRGKKAITLTEEGLFLRSRAAEILGLLEQTETVFQTDEQLDGCAIHVCCSEIPLPEFVTSTFLEMRKTYPLLQLHLYNENSDAVIDLMDKGLVDIGLLFTPSIHADYEHYPTSIRNRWGLLMPATCALARQETVRPEDIVRVPLIYPFKVFHSRRHPNHFPLDTNELTITAVYNQFEDAASLTARGLGYAYTMERTYPADRYPDLVFRPLTPEITTPLHLIVKKGRDLLPTTRQFLQQLQVACAH